MLRDHQPELGGIRVDPKKDKRAAHAGRRRHGEVGAKEGRFVTVGSSSFIANNILRFTGIAPCPST